jgi:hypothetical protein
MAFLMVKKKLPEVLLVTSFLLILGIVVFLSYNHYSAGLGPRDRVLESYALGRGQVLHEMWGT